jgi:peptidoglycan/LPS O-acetylase OafA/YrhL
LKKRSDIQYLRGIAVLAVFLFHAFPDQFSNGYLGVDLFFFVSGFLIFPQLLKAISQNDLSLTLSELKLFLIRRMRRIAPALGCSIVFFTVLGYFFLPPSANYLQNQYTQSASAIFGLGNLVAAKDAVDYFNSDSAFLHYWTLGVEIQTYFFSALLALVIFQIKSRGSSFSVKHLFVFVLSVLTIVSLVLRVITFEYPQMFGLIGMQSTEISPSSFDFYFSTNRFWEFSAGGLAAFCSSRVSATRLEIRLRNTLRNSLLLSMVLFLVISESIIPKGFKSILLILVGCSYLLLFENQEKRLGLFKFLQWIGDRSYSLYLYHLPFLVILGGTFVPSDFRTPLKLLALIITLFAGDISYRYIEERYRFHRFIDDANLKSRQLLSYLLVSFAIPLSLMFLLTVNSSANMKESQDSSWEESYAASESFPCSLGQIDSSCDLNVVSGQQRWMLIGDSHAGAIQQTINDIAVERKVSFKVWNKCRFFDPSISEELNSFFPDWCLVQNTERIKVINSGEISLLLIHYFDSKVVFGDKTLPNALWLSVFEKSLSNLRNKQTLLLGQIPVFDDTQYDRPRVSFPIKQDVPISDISSMSASKKRIERQIARNSGVDYVDLTSAFCSVTQCTRKDRVWLYVDSNHLSIEGAKRIKPIVEKFIENKFELEGS